MKSFILKNKTLLLEFLLRIRIFISIILGINIKYKFNLIDINLINFIVNRILWLINNYNVLDNQLKLIINCILIILICFVYIFYIFSFVIAPSIFDAIKDILPIRIKDYLIKLININRKVSVPFVILSFIMLIIGLLFVLFFLSIAVIFKSSFT